MFILKAIDKYYSYLLNKLLFVAEGDCYRNPQLFQIQSTTDLQVPTPD